MLQGGGVMKVSAGTKERRAPGRGNRLDGTGRWLMVLAAALLIVSIRLPLWAMTLHAPQYPEGLRLYVYPGRLGGKVDIINTLNHYVGMKELREEDFPEFRYLPPILAAVAGLMLLAALGRWRWLATALLALAPAGLLGGIYDLHRWLYRYGHNLDPRAPIDIPPFSPPVLGVKQIMNFRTFSYFSWGALLLAVSFLLVAAAARRRELC